jgi:threonine synthase
MHVKPRCTQCGSNYPDEGTPYLCACGGTYNYFEFPEFIPSKVDRSRMGLWKYEAMFGLDATAPVISLGEGDTPLIETTIDGHQILAKLEYQNPTGSYKDRGSAILTSFLASRNVENVVEDSSGNAGASLAAYAARAGMHARIFVPESASGPKRKQIECFGAELVGIPGPRASAAQAVRNAVSDTQIYASHAYMPFGLCGIASIAYELVDGLGGKTPGTVIAPVGHGGLIYGLIRGFKALKTAAVVKEEPYYLGVQAAGCAPIYDAYQKHEYTLREPHESDTIAEGVRVRAPIHGTDILHEMDSGRGQIDQVTEDDLIDAYWAMAGKGFFVEPTSALPWAAFTKLPGNIPEPVVLILTGAGFKTKL